MKINLGGVISLSANEWKDHVSIVIFFNGCPFNCAYCHNSQMIDAINYVDIDIVKDEIRKSLPFVNSICFTGGEPTMNQKPLEEILKFAKSLNLSTLIETNGYFPEILKNLYEKRLVDELYIDIKTTKEEYPGVTKKSDAYDRLLETLKVPIPHTTRTTIFKNIKIPKCSTLLQRGLLRLSPDKTLEEYTLEEFERLIFTNKRKHLYTITSY